MTNGQRPQHRSNPVLMDSLPYVVPYGIFILLTFAADYFPAYRSLVYIFKTIVVAAALWHYRKSYTELRPRITVATVVAVIVGVLIIVAWVGLDPYYPQTGEEFGQLMESGALVFEHAEKAAGQFDPYDGSRAISPVLAIIFRFIGAVLVVPVFEELFVRSWLLRFIIRDNFRSVATGSFTWASLIVTAAFFGLAHHEWLAAIICSVALNLLLYWKKDLFQCIVAHAVANLVLGIYVVSQGAWMFW